MEETLSHIDMCLCILQLVRTNGRTPRVWQFSPAMWMVLAYEARPAFVHIDPTQDDTLSLFGVPVDVSADHPGVSLRVI